MKHHESTRLLGAYLDRELDLGASLDLEAHLEECSECRQELEKQKALVRRIESDSHHFTSPPFLKTRILAELRKNEAPADSTSLRWKFSLPWIYSGLGAAALLLLFTVIFPRNSDSSLLLDEAVANHVRSLQASHLVDVASSDQHTVKPWFSGKLDFSPQVVDLGPSGYPVLGGRLDVLNGREVAAVVYQRRKHSVNLFIWPDEGKPSGNHASFQRGYHVLRWDKAGMNYLAVSEVGENELKTFSQLIQEQTVDPNTME